MHTVKLNMIYDNYQLKFAIMTTSKPNCQMRMIERKMQNKANKFKRLNYS